MGNGAATADAGAGTEPFDSATVDGGSLGGGAATDTAHSDTSADVQPSDPNKLLRPLLGDGGWEIGKQGELFAGAMTTILSADNKPETDNDGDCGYITNNASIVQMLQLDKHRLLFTGDINGRIDKTFSKDVEPIDVEKKLVAAKLDLKANVLQVPHHGHDTSSSHAFISAVKPTWAVAMDRKWIPKIGSGSFLPKDKIVDRYKDAGVKFFTASKDNLVFCWSKAGKLDCGKNSELNGGTYKLRAR